MKTFRLVFMILIMSELADFIGYGSSGGGKEVSVLNADRLFQQGYILIT